jgi:hypothetical protein
MPEVADDDVLARGGPAGELSGAEPGNEGAIKGGLAMIE